jgi:SsrA-binding protein
MASKIFSKNKKAFHDYKVLDRYEAGVALLGSEVKAIKAGLASLKESFIEIDHGQLWLWNCHIPQWKYSRDRSYNPTRKRRLLMNRKEIDSLAGKVNQKSFTLIPLSLYGQKGKIKVEIGLCQGLRKYDKRRKLKEREQERDLRKEKRKFMI